jgi:hypothetical protein
MLAAVHTKTKHIVIHRAQSLNVSLLQVSSEKASRTGLYCCENKQARRSSLLCLESSLPKWCEMPKKLEQIGWFLCEVRARFSMKSRCCLQQGQGSECLNAPSSSKQTSCYFLSAMCRLVEMFQSTELMVGLALLRRVKPSGPRRFVLRSHSLIVNTFLLHFVLFPVRLILISFHSQGICSVRWSDSGHPRHALIPSLYKSSCCILLLAAWVSARGLYLSNVESTAVASISRVFTTTDDSNPGSSSV